MLHESARTGQSAQESQSGGQPTATSGNATNGSPQPAVRRCALCGKNYQVTERKFAPFCSERCQQIDLGNWLSESYGMPWEDPAGGDLGDYGRDDE